MDLKDVIKNINDAKEQLQKSVNVEKSEQDAEQQEEADKSVEPKTKEEAGGKAPVEKSEVEDKEAPEDDSEDHDDDEEEHEDDEESSENDAEKACNVEDDDAEKSCGDKKVAKSDDSEDDSSEDDGADDEVEACDQRTKSSDIDKSVFMQHLEMFENLSKSYIDLANSSIELAQSVLTKSINNTNNQEVVEKSAEPEPEDEADSETQAEDDDVEKSVAPEAESEVPAEKDNVEKSAEPEPEPEDKADDVEKSMPKGKSLQYADDAPEDDGIEKSVDSDEVKVSELKDAVAKSIQGLQGYVLMNREQGMLKSLLHKVDELDPDDVAPKELVDAYNKI